MKNAIFTLVLIASLMFSCTSESQEKGIKSDQAHFIANIINKRHCSSLIIEKGLIPVGTEIIVEDDKYPAFFSFTDSTAEYNSTTFDHIYKLEKYKTIFHDLFKLCMTNADTKEMKCYNSFEYKKDLVLILDSGSKITSEEKSNGKIIGFVLSPIRKSEREKTQIGIYLNKRLNSS